MRSLKDSEAVDCTGATFCVAEFMVPLLYEKGKKPAQFHHALDRQSPAGRHFFLDLPVDRGFPVNACSIRCSSMRCKHPFKKTISTVCWPILRSSSEIRPSGLCDRYPRLQSPYGGQLELLGELPARQSHDSILHSMVLES
jgi:hypothetical protein